MPYSEEFGDFYYSRADGRAECRHVFLGGNGLPARFAATPHFLIGELGFGTGLNFIETWSVWEATAPEAATLEFHSFELHPLRRSDMTRALSAWPDLAARTAQLVAAWPEAPGGDIRLDFASGGRSISLQIHAGLALDTLEAARLNADAWYLDGFSPSRNPDMWSGRVDASGGGGGRDRVEPSPPIRLPAGCGATFRRPASLWKNGLVMRASAP